MFQYAVKSFWKSRDLKWISLFLLTILVAAPSVLAHNVTVFAWVEGDTVYTESKFAGGKMAKNAPLEVYDASGARLLSGKTDENGEFSFKLPKKEELKIVLKAGMGHGNEWILTAEDIADAQTESSGSPPASSQVIEAPPSQASLPNKESKERLEPTNLDLEVILDKKLAPVLKKLSHIEAKQKKERGITEILGGIGYILGLMGLAVFIHYRRKINGLDSESKIE